MRASLATRADLPGILELQRANLEANARDPVGQGFVTVVHTLDVLERMHALAPSVVVRDGDVLAGYALVMLQECAPWVPVLQTMFANLRTLSWRGRPLTELRWYVMGQVCVAESHRGRGVFDALYAGHAEFYGPPRFDLVVTEAATRNTRSLRAHARVGFETIDTYRDEVDEWAVLAWDFAS